MKETIYLQKHLYLELIRLSVLVDENAREPSIYGQMSALVKKAKYAVNGDTDKERIQQLLDLVYDEWQFGCSYADCFFAEELLIHRVLSQHRGMPIALSAIVLYLAAILQLPLYPVNFPTQLILRAEMCNERGRTEVSFLNPRTGKPLGREEMTKWLEGEMGYGASVKMDMLGRAETDELTECLETAFKMSLTREGNYESTLRIIEYRLALTPDDPYEIRDRGMVLASMDCPHAALEDLDYFISQCPDDPSAAMLKLELPALRKQSQAAMLH